MIAPKASPMASPINKRVAFRIQERCSRTDEPDAAQLLPELGDRLGRCWPGDLAAGRGPPAEEVPSLVKATSRARMS